MGLIFYLMPPLKNFHWYYEVVSIKIRKSFISVAFWGVRNHNIHSWFLGIESCLCVGNLSCAVLIFLNAVTV